MSVFRGSPDRAAVEAILCEMRDQLLSSQQQPQADAAVQRLRENVKRLEGVASPLFIMSVLATYLFREVPPASDANHFTSPEALTLLGILVALDRSTYLKPASVAVRHEAERLATSLDHADQPMYVSPELRNVMIQQLESTDVQASANAKEAIVACCQKLGPSFATTALQDITSSWKRSKEAAAVAPSSKDKSHVTTTWVRYADAVVAIASLEDSFMDAAVSCGGMKLLLDMMLDDSDPLLQISTLDLIERLASTQPMHHQRALWLFSQPVVQPLLRMAGGGYPENDDDGDAKMDEQDLEPDPMIGGPALRAVACLCALGHRDASLYGGLDDNTKLLQGFHHALHNFPAHGEMDRLAVMDAIFNFASASPSALELILSDPVTREAWLSINVAQPKLQAAILHSVAMVVDPTLSATGSAASYTLPPQQQQLQQSAADSSAGETLVMPPDHRQSSKAAAMGLKLFHEWGRTNGEEVATNLALSLARSALPETRLGAYALLQAVAKLPTGGQVLLAHPGFYEWLINREGKNTKEGREAKYAIVQTIYNSDVRRLLADDIVRKLEQYIKQGPHYQKAMPWELATE